MERPNEPNRRDGYVTTHVLDTSRGRPASGLRIDVYRLSDALGTAREHITSLTTNADGRTDIPAIDTANMAAGSYEFMFHAGAYLEQVHGKPDGVAFLDMIPVRFGVTDPSQHYHVPLLLSPFGYSTYRGS